MLNLKMKDSRGKDSFTKFCVVVGMLVSIVGFFSGMLGSTEFITIWMSLGIQWGHREQLEKKNGVNIDSI